MDSLPVKRRTTLFYDVLRSGPDVNLRGRDVSITFDKTKQKGGLQGRGGSPGNRLDKKKEKEKVTTKLGPKW